jgi:hypothetical protein
MTAGLRKARARVYTPNRRLTPAARRHHALCSDLHRRPRQAFPILGPW